MSDAGTASNLPAGSTASPNADSIGVDPSLEALAAFIVSAQTAWTTHDGATVNNLLETFWSAEQGFTPAARQSYGTLIGGTVAQDLTALDAYSHRILGYEYLWQISQADPSDMPNLVALEAAQFAASSSEFAAAGLPLQSSHDASIGGQAQTMAAQDASAWIDDSYVASVKATINADLNAAGNLISSAGSIFSALSNPWILAGVVGLGVIAFLSTRK